MNGGFHRRYGSTLASVALALTPACNHVVASQVLYAGTIEKIEDLPGAHYTPAQGRTPVTKLQVRSSAHGTLWILVPGVYGESLYGAVGDSVTFRRPATIPFDGTFWIDQLGDYAVVVRKKG